MEILLRSLLRLLGRIIEILLTRTTVTGFENIPAEGALIFAGNHASTYDPVLVMNHLPITTRLVGPGDFKLLFPANVIVERLGVIRIQRGAADRDSLKEMTAVLKAGQRLALFPEGGTWEKRLDDVKPGAAYLALTTGAQIIPVAIGGTYQVWWKIFTFQRPYLTLYFAPPLPPIESQDRKQRNEALQQASLKLMEIIYHHLPPVEQARYDLHTRQQFSAMLEIAPDVLEENPPTDFPVLAEVFSKPNLRSPLYHNLRLPIRPFMNHKRFYAPQQFMDAADALHHALNQTVPGYLNYRLGDRKAAAAFGELEAISKIAQEAAKKDAAMRFSPRVDILIEPLPPNM